MLKKKRFPDNQAAPPATELQPQAVVVVGIEKQLAAVGSATAVMPVTENKLLLVLPLFEREIREFAVDSRCDGTKCQCGP